ncbi:asparagine synthase (glutamine-hydrolyzing) [Butyrivibrio sp. AE2032]|uniref:asparagine synthase (glutamine-hydrolyzing) n=1 Tax=Butyrivibrio sp. AE2032 TaxID=1458463 RepID=UPI0005519308|nr:asparagine synthase (glutamine-hydrolyzing) [Butyrivibrio sp. AE2032]
MCGICGYVGKKRIDDKVLNKMRDTMTHRGPNDAGSWQIASNELFIGLAHRRLSIFDLSELGHQPMHTADGRVSIVFNGEVYNFKELRKELEKDGYTIKSDCDTEVILYSYAKWGEECFSKFNGMFAIAIWDSREEKLVIARDRMGVKPFFYYFNPEEHDFVFGSELKPIMLYPSFHKEIDYTSLANYLCYKFVAAPRTIFKNTYKLESGTYAVLKGNQLTICKYWDIAKQKESMSSRIITNFDSAKRELNEVLTDAVMKRMVADVPVGTFLSSGIDSALITAIAQKNLSTPVRTFTIGFNEKERNEADKAAEIAKYLGTDHTELYIGDKEIFDMLEGIVTYYDEPFSDASQLPTMLVSKLAADNVTVALSGDGGDELFCGYKMYDLVDIAQKVDWVGNLLYHIPGMNAIKGSIRPEVRALINNRSDDFRTQLFIDVTAEQVSNILGGVAVNPKHPDEARFKYKNWQERRMLLDMVTYLPDEIMCKTDRASMKYSLEVRSPLLDYRVVEKSFRIPHEYKFTRDIKAGSFPKNVLLGDKKHILKALAYDYIPKEYLSGPKRGFGVPLAKWLRGPLKKEIMRYADESYLRQQGLFDSEGVRKLIQIQEHNNTIIYSSVLWSFYMFQRWWEEYME